MYSGDYKPALDHFTRALQIARETHDANNEVAWLNDIGNIFYFQGRYSDAMAQYEEATRLIQWAGDTTWAGSRRQLTTANIAILYQTLGQYEQALSLFNALLQSRQQLPPKEQAQLLTNIGVLRRRLGDPIKALDAYHAAQALYRRAAHRDGEILLLNNIGIVEAMDLRDSPAAISTFSKALRLATESHDRPRIVHACLYRGEALYRAGRINDSATDFETALAAATPLGEHEEEWKALHGLARIALDRGDRDRGTRLLLRAAQIIESMRAGLGGSALRSTFLADKRDVYDLLIENTAAADQVFHYMEQSRARTLRDRMELKTQPDLAVLARTLPDDTATVEYWVRESSAAALWITNKQTGLVRWELTSKDRSALAALPSSLSDRTRADWRDTAQTVAGRLLSGIPALSDPRIRKLRIIPDGALTQIPFEALPFEAGLLIDRFTISYSPSASALLQRRTQSRLRWPWQTTIEAFADPAPGPASGAAIELRSWPRLPEAVSEVTSIARILGGQSALHIGADARKRFLDQLLGTPVLHFATHAFADLENPDLSYVLLAPATPSQRFDYLFLREVASLPLTGVELATLSACQTETGKSVPGEGAQGFSRAFLAAGVPSVVASLWSVGDKATAALMIRFYSHLTVGQNKAEALRQAKLEFLREPRAAHPANWAAFIIAGDSDSRLPYIISWGCFAAVPAISVFVVLVMIRMRRVRKA